ncbi:MAG: methyltransferase domain-containing protein [Gammaproteobacteria bacterium]|nr:methyltransferase domain-containing protein [Gammaproteobacteria bacterium]
MGTDSFYTDHWKQIEEERIARYERMFVWREGHKSLLAPAAIGEGQTVLDVGSGPGFFALALADMVGDAGRVDGVDINARFVGDANSRARDRDNVAFHQVTDHRLPFPDGDYDRVICKNVLEYVPDLEATLGEVRRVLKPEGRIHVIDSDWGFVIVEPWGKKTVDRFFAAAAAAFKEPHIGRKAAGLMAAAGFSDIEVRLSTFVDREGTALNVLINMAGYIKSLATLPDEEVATLLNQATEGINAGSYLFCLPQFLITGVR